MSRVDCPFCGGNGNLVARTYGVFGEDHNVSCQVCGGAGHVAESLIMHTCSCGQRYTAEMWSDLRYIGEQDDGVEVIELRACEACRTTRSRVVWVKREATT